MEELTTEAPKESFPRRAARSRTVRTAVVAGLVGALFGAGVIAWTGTPFRDAEAAPCWGSFGEETMTSLFGEQKIRNEEQRLERRRGDLTYGECRVTGLREHGIGNQVTVRVHELDGLYGLDGHRWPQEFLAGDMSALGKGLTGMASGSHAWLALPASCTGKPRPDSSEAATVVDVSMGRGGPMGDAEDEKQGKFRAALARAVVEAGNGAMRALGCTASFPEAPASLPPSDTEERPENEPICGVKGLSLPAGYTETGSKRPLRWQRIAGEGGSVRICEAGALLPGMDLRLTTVTEPGLVNLFTKSFLHGGTRVEGDKGGYGAVNANRAAYWAECPSGPVVYLVEQIRAIDGHSFDLTGALLPAYVKGEAERIGCGPETLRPPTT
ncbi:hypothetical protein [Streptomyces exfoliatus]|uniref:hypothetical protein n=1 Tax=Streptomyces exfoliatus TaxID=1905 RepID=UPI003C2D4D39